MTRHILPGDMETAAPRKTVRFGPFEADLQAHELFREGRKVTIQEQPFQILNMLLERPGEMVTRDELRHRLWSADTFVDFDLGLNKAVAKLREALGDDASSPQFIETLPKRGYRLIAPVDQTATASVKPRPRWRLAALVSLVIASALGLSVLFRNVSTTAQATPRSHAVIAVLPFMNLSVEPSEAYLSDAITVELITALTQARPDQLRVIAPTSAFTYRNTTRPVRDIAEELGANYVVEGSVRSDGERLRVTAQLTDVSDQTVRWTQTFDRSRKGLFQTQSEVSRSIADAVEIEILPAKLAAMRVPPTTDAAAYDAYLEGLFHQRMKGSADDAAPRFQRAVELDANFAEAWAGLARSSIYLKPSRENMPRAAQAARRALELDPDLGSAHAVLATVHLMWEWDWARAEEEFERALALEPNDPDTLVLQAQFLAASGKLDQAIVVARRAQRLDPRSPLIGQILGRLYYFNRQPENALDEWKRSLELDPDFYWSHLFLSFLYEDRGMDEKWYEHHRRAFEINGVPDSVLNQFDRLAMQEGYEQASQRLLSFREEKARQMGPEAMSLAITYSKRGNREKALEWLEKALENRPNDAIFLGIDPAYDPIRADPRFQAALKRVGIPSGAAR